MCIESRLRLCLAGTGVCELFALRTNCFCGLAPKLAGGAHASPTAASAHSILCQTGLASEHTSAGLPLYRRVASSNALTRWSWCGLCGAAMNSSLHSRGKHSTISSAAVWHHHAACSSSFVAVLDT